MYNIINIELKKKKKEARTEEEGLTTAMYQGEKSKRGGEGTEKARKEEGGAEDAAGTRSRDHRVIIYGVYGGSVNRKGS